MSRRYELVRVPREHLADEDNGQHDDQRHRYHVTVACDVLRANQPSVEAQRLRLNGVRMRANRSAVVNQFVDLAVGLLEKDASVHSFASNVIVGLV